MPIPPDGYASHLPVLSSILDWYRRDPAFLHPIEVGAGFYSTPLILACGGDSFEADTQWMNTIKKLGYGIRDVSVLWDWVNPLQRGEGWRSPEWSFAFIDCAPESARLKWAKILRPHCQMIVLHDSDPEWDAAYQYSTIRDTFKYQFEYRRMRPYTLVLSDVQDLKFLHEELGTP